MVNRLKVTAAPEGHGFDGWFFEDGYFCDRNGQRYSPVMISVCQMVIQMEASRDLLYYRPSQIKRDLVLHSCLDNPKPSQVLQQDYTIQVFGLESHDRSQSTLCSGNL